MRTEKKEGKGYGYDRWVMIRAHHGDPCGWDGLGMDVAVFEEYRFPEFVYIVLFSYGGTRILVLSPQAREEGWENLERAPGSDVLGGHDMCWASG